MRIWFFQLQICVPVLQTCALNFYLSCAIMKLPEKKSMRNKVRSLNQKKLEIKCIFYCTTVKCICQYIRGIF